MKKIELTSIVLIKQSRNLKFRKKQSAFSLVELMIAGFLGLVLIGGVLQLFVGSNQNYRMQDDLAVIQEDGRLALMFLKEQIQQASWAPNIGDDLLPPIRLPNFDPDALATETTEGAAGASDSIAISYWSAADCNGNAPPVNQPVINRFFVGNNQLMCLGNGSVVPQPLIAGVESFQILYGIENSVVPGCFSGRITGYMTATQLGLANPRLTSILSVKVGLSLVSDDDVLLANSPSRPVARLLDQTINQNDRLARRIFQQTIFMPNVALQAIGSPQGFGACGN